MKIDTLKNILLKSIRIGIALTLFSPLILGPFGLDIIEYPKAVFFRSIVEIIFALYIFLLLLDKKYLPKFSPLLISIITFDVILIISSIFGINFYHSFFGDMNRAEGIIMHLHLLVFFVIITSIFSKKEDWLDLFKISVFVSGIVSFTAVLQQLNIIQLFNMYPPRISGTMSNPDIFGSYIALTIFIALFLFISEQKKNLKIVWIILAALNCYTLFFSATRGSIIGAALGLALILFYMFLNLDYKKRGLVLGIILILCIIILIMFINLKSLEKLPGASVLNRFTELNLNGREKIWAAFPPAFTAKPILGWGYDSFIFISNKYMKTGQVTSFFYDRAHNKLLEILLYSGIVGFISYLSIFFIIFYLILKYGKPWNKSNNKLKVPYSLIILSFFVCYFIQNIFLFDNVNTYILFFLVAGFANNAFYSPEKSLKTNDSFIPKKSWPIVLKIFFAAIVFLVITDTIYEVNIKPTIAAMNFPAAAGSDYKKAFSDYKNAIKMHTIYDNDLTMNFIDGSLNLLENNNYGNDFKQEIIDELIKTKPFLYKNIKTEHQKVSISYEYLARIDEQKYLLDKDEKDLSDMENILKGAISFNPYAPATYELFGELKILKNSYPEGESYIKKGCSMDNSMGACGEDKLYRRMAQAYSKKGDIQNEIKNLQKVFDIYYTDYKNKKNQNDITPLNFGKFTNYLGTRYCQQLNDLQNCQKVFKKGMEIMPQYEDIFKQRLIQLNVTNN